MSRATVVNAAVAALVAGVAVVALHGCDRGPEVAAPATQSSPTPTPVTAVVVPVEGMSCAACVASVRKAVKSVEGVTAVEVNLAQRDARVEYDAARVSPDKIVNAINDAGFKAGDAKGAAR